MCAHPRLGLHKKTAPPPTHPKPVVKMEQQPLQTKLSSNRNIASTISKLRGRPAGQQTSTPVDNNSEYSLSQNHMMAAGGGSGSNRLAYGEKGEAET